MQSPAFPEVHLSMLQSVEFPEVMRVKLIHPSAPAVASIESSISEEMAKSHTRFDRPVENSDDGKLRPRC